MNTRIDRCCNVGHPKFQGATPVTAILHFWALDRGGDESASSNDGVGYADRFDGPFTADDCEQTRMEVLALGFCAECFACSVAELTGAATVAAILETSSQGFASSRLYNDTETAVLERHWLADMEQYANMTPCADCGDLCSEEKDENGFHVDQGDDDDNDEESEAE